MLGDEGTFPMVGVMWQIGGGGGGEGAEHTGPRQTSTGKDRGSYWGLVYCRTGLVTERLVHSSWATEVGYGPCFNVAVIFRDHMVIVHGEGRN